MKPAPPLTRSAVTGVDNLVELRPFTANNLRPPARWDPITGRLPLAYDIIDPNALIQTAEVHYLASDPKGSIVVARRKLSQFTQGSHTIPAGERWDGTIEEGLDQRIGEKVTADLSLITIRIEVFNTPGPHGTLIPGLGGLTDVVGEFVAVSTVTTEIDAIVEAKWDRSFVIPHGDPLEPQNGFAKMLIKVKNVREGTPVHIFVRRINDIANPASDFDYVDDSAGFDLQPTLQNVSVTGNKVLRADGDVPIVRFNNFAEHWSREGNNFYCFVLQFDQGDPMVASERDHAKKETQCLHMRFTVFIHGGASDLSDVSAGSQELFNFFKSTKFYRPFMIIGNAPGLEAWFNLFKHRYIVILICHASARCRNPDHPKDAAGKPMDPLHVAFEPDANVCPKVPLDDAASRALIAEEEAERKIKFAGCGQKPFLALPVSLAVTPDSGRLMLWNDVEGVVDSSMIRLLNDKESRAFKLKNFGPRMFLYNGGCRTMMTTNMGELFIINGTRFYGGWRWSSAANSSVALIRGMCRNWIKGSPGDPAPNEFDTSRIPAAFLDAEAKIKGPNRHARLLDTGGLLIPPDPAAITRALA